MGEGQLSTGLFFSAEFLRGQLLTSGKFRPGLILTGQILTTKVGVIYDILVTLNAFFILPFINKTLNEN